MNRQIPDRRRVAGQWIAGVPRIGESLESHRTGIDHEEATNETFAETDDLADDLQRHQRAKHTWQCAENSRRCAGRYGALRWRLRKQASTGWIACPISLHFVRTNRSERTIEGPHRSG